jgi:type IV pilus assembly protein PilF
MNNKAAAWRCRQWLFCACLLISALAGISGCASRTGGTGPDGNGSEIMTDSDEPNARKRARIRLELASGYFEQGQTTIALDELKQSIAADPNYAAAYNLRGLIYLRLNDFRFAEESFGKALAIEPQDASVMHNLGWLYCQEARYPLAQQIFSKALAMPQYRERAKTWRAQGLCQVRAGQRGEGEQSLIKSYELEPGNPVTAYNLATLMFQRGEFARAQFYVRRLNNSELANEESLWLGIKVEQRMENRIAMQQLGSQLLKRFPQSRQADAFQRGAFDE